MDWANEEWRKVYIRDTPDIIAIGWEGRLVLWELIRKVDRAGVIDIGADDDPILADTLRIPIDILRTGLDRLLDRKTVQRTDRAIVIVNFVDAQEAQTSDRIRQKMSRDRRRLRTLENGPSQDVTRDVTDGHIREEKRREEIKTPSNGPENGPPGGPLGAGEVGGSTGAIQLKLIPDEPKAPRIVPAALQAAYAGYPRKEGKKAGLEKLGRILRDAKDPPGTLERVVRAKEAYAALCRREQREVTKIKHFDTFINNWEDYEPEPVKPVAILAPSKPPAPPPPDMSDAERQAIRDQARSIRDRIAGKFSGGST